MLLLFLNVEIAAVDAVVNGVVTITAAAVAEHVAPALLFPVGGVVGSHRSLSPRTAAIELDRLRVRKRRRPAPVVASVAGVVTIEARARAEALEAAQVRQVDAPSGEVVVPELLPPVVAVIAGEITIVAHVVAETWDFEAIEKDDAEILELFLMMQAMKRSRRASGARP